VLAKEKPENINYLGYVGTTAAWMGNWEDARRISGELQKMERPYIFGNHIYWQGCIAALLGEKELAIKFLREAIIKGALYTRLRADMDLESLRNYPPFKELIKPKD